MVLWQLLAEVRRHRLVALVGLVASLAVAAVVFQWPAVYSTRVNAIFLNPRPITADPVEVVNPYHGSRSNLVSTAGVVARMLDQQNSMTLSGSDSVSLLAQGVKSGYAVALPNSGGQWVFRFDKAELDVEVVGRSEAEVEKLLGTAMGEIRHALQVREQAVGAPRESWVRVVQSPRQAVAVEQTGDRRRASVMALFVGLLLTLTAIHQMQDDRRRFRGSASLPEPRPRPLRTAES